jgi:uncharacterized membrane protein
MENRIKNTILVLIGLALAYQTYELYQIEKQVDKLDCVTNNKCTVNK